MGIHTYRRLRRLLALEGGLVEVGRPHPLHRTRSNLQTRVCTQGAAVRMLPSLSPPVVFIFHPSAVRTLTAHVASRPIFRIVFRRPSKLSRLVTTSVAPSAAPLLSLLSSAVPLRTVPDALFMPAPPPPPIRTSSPARSRASLSAIEFCQTSDSTAFLFEDTADSAPAAAPKPCPPSFQAEFD